MSKEVKWKDPNQYHEAVCFYRETFNLQMNAGWRRDVVATVKTHDDLLLWQDTLMHWGYFKDGRWKARSPLDVRGMINVFEYRQREAQRKKDELREKAISARSRESVPARPLGRMPQPLVPVLSKGSHGFKG